MVLGHRQPKAVGRVDRVRVVGVGPGVGDVREVRVELVRSLVARDRDVVDGAKRLSIRLVNVCPPSRLSSTNVPAITRRELLIGSTVNENRGPGSRRLYRTTCRRRRSTSAGRR